MGLRPYQIDAVNAFARFLATGKRRGVLVLPTGCIAGDVPVPFELRLRGQRSTHGRISLERLFRKFNAPDRLTRGAEFFVPSATDEDIFRLSKIEAVVDSGVKPVFRVTTESGRMLKATADHEFMVESGFRPLARLSVGDRVAIYAGKPQPRGGRRAAPYRKEVFVKFHPTATTKVVSGCVYYRLRVYQAVFEAHKNMLSYEDYVALLNGGDRERVLTLWTIPEGYDVHHLDENHENDAIENLALVEHADHARKHGGSGPKRYVELDPIVAIEPLWPERVYDVKCVDPYHNFVAGGVVVHNCGKTRTGLAVVENQRKRTLWIAHRDELLRQPAAQLAEVWPDAQFGIVKGAENECDARDVVFASIQTLARGTRLDRCGKFDLVVIDECHHATAASYRRVLERLGCLPAQDAVSQIGSLARLATPVLGLSATPDSKGLAKVFDEIFYQLPVRDAVQQGFLCKIATPVRVEVPKLDLREIATQNGDFAPGQLGRALLASQAANVSALALARHARTRRTLVFTATVAQASATANALLDQGFRAGVISADTPHEERKATLEAFASGKLAVLCNAAILTEGFDCPRIDCVVVARPTKSAILYRQMIGRGLRLHAEKRDLLVVDLYGAYDRHDLMSAGKLLDGEFAAAKKTIKVRLVKQPVSQLGVAFDAVKDVLGWAFGALKKLAG